MKYLSLLLVLLTTAAPLLAQQVGTLPPPPQKPEDLDVVRITSNLVQVDAVITDGHGKLVTDLKPEEIEIVEDGHKQKITHFSLTLSESASGERTLKPATSEQTANPMPPARLRREDVKRTIAIVVDDLGLSWESTAF